MALIVEPNLHFMYPYITFPGASALHVFNASAVLPKVDSNQTHKGLILLQFSDKSYKDARVLNMFLEKVVERENTRITSRNDMSKVVQSPNKKTLTLLFLFARYILGTV